MKSLVLIEGFQSEKGELQKSTAQRITKILDTMDIKDNILQTDNTLFENMILPEDIQNGFSNWKKMRVCQVFCVSFKKNFYGEGNLPIVRILYFYKLTRQSILDKHLHFIV